MASFGYPLAAELPSCVRWMRSSHPRWCTSRGGTGRGVWATGIGNIDVSVGEGEVDIETLVDPLFKWAAALRVVSTIPINFESRLDKVTSRC